MSPDLDPVKDPPFSEFFPATNYRFLHSPTGALQAPNSETRPENRLPREFLRQKYEKKVVTRDARLGSEEGINEA